MKCSRDGCDNEAAYKVTLLLYAATGDVPAEGDLPVQVCHEHKALATKQELVTREWMRKVGDEFVRVGKARPSYERSKLKFTELS